MCLSTCHPGSRGGASPEKVGWKRDGIDGQKVYLTILMSFLLRNEYRPEESGVDMSNPVHPVAPPLPGSFVGITLGTRGMLFITKT